jgi:hypothetical protein
MFLVAQVYRMRGKSGLVTAATWACDFWQIRPRWSSFSGSDKVSDYSASSSS